MFHRIFIAMVVYLFELNLISIDRLQLTVLASARFDRSAIILEDSNRLVQLM